MKNSTLQQQAFTQSKKGRLIACIEMALIMSAFSAITSALILQMMTNAKLGIVGRNYIIMVMAVVGVVFGVIIANFTGICIFSYKIFPPNEKAINTYKIARKNELEKEKACHQRGIEKINKELAEL